MSFFNIKTKIFIKKLCFAFLALALLALISISSKNTKTETVHSSALEDIPSKVCKLNVFIDERDYDFLFSDLPLSLRTFQKAKIIADDQPKIYNADFRLRGTHSWHWYKEKPSFRLRFSGENKLYSRKELDLINPEDASGFCNVISEIMAAKAGLPYFSATFCQVTINNKYKGLYLMADRVNGENLRNFGKATGSVLNGNDWDLGIWNNEKLWGYEQNIDVALQEEIESNLKKLLLLLKKPLNVETYESIINSIDIDGTAKWSAFMTAIGSVHTDDLHNNFFVYDKSKKIFCPVITDPSGFGVLTSISNENSSSSIELPIYEYLTPVFNCLFRNPEFQYKRNTYMYSFLKNSLSKEYVHELVTDWRRKIEPLYDLEDNASALITVPELLFPIRLPVSAEFRRNDIDRLLQYYDLRHDFLIKQLEFCDVTIQPYCADNNSDIMMFVVGVKGNSPVKWVFDKSIEVYFDNDLNKRISKEEILNLSEILFYPALHELSSRQLNLPSSEDWFMLDHRIAKYILFPDTQTYLIGIHRKHEKEVLNLFKNCAVNAVTGSPVCVNIKENQADDNILYQNKDSIHYWSRNAKN